MATAEELLRWASEEAQKRILSDYRNYPFKGTLFDRAISKDQFLATRCAEAERRAAELQHTIELWEACGASHKELKEQFAPLLHRAEQAEAKLAKLREAAATLTEGFDKGIFIRSTAGDFDGAWAIKLFPYLRALAFLAEIDAGAKEE